MNKKGVFREPNVLVTMLFLRKSGWALKDLAYLFGCEHSSVRRMCSKYGVFPTQLRSQPTVRFTRVLLDLDGDRINPGKSYAEYLAEEKKRHQRSRGGP